MSNLSTTYDDILDSAQTLIVAGGYNGFSYADIATVVGIRKASIHHHFPSKVDLVRTLVVRYRQTAEEGMDTLTRNISEPFELLQTYADWWAKCIEDASMPFCVCALLAGELPVLPQEVAVEVRAYFRFLAGWLTSVIERGSKAGVINISSPPAVEAETFMATVHGSMLSARAYGDPQIFNLVLKPTLERFLNRSGFGGGSSL